MPVVYKFPIPDWKPESLRLNKSLVCKNDEESPDLTCPIPYHLEGLISDFSETMRFYKDVYSTSGGDFYEQNFSCDKIKPHFLHFSTQAGGLGPYLSEYKTRCFLGKSVSLTVKNLSNGASHHAQAAYEKFKELHENSKDKKGSEWKFTEMTGYAALQNSYLFSQYVDSIRWSNAFTTCQSFRLDVGLLSPEMLNESLSEMSQTVSEAGYNFSLPFLGGSLPHYYKLPLVDCILTIGNFSENGKDDSSVNIAANLIIRVLVPLVKSDVTYKLVKLNKVPYLVNEKGTEKICEIQNFLADDTFLIEINDTSQANTIIGKVSTLCSSSRLCKIPEITHRHVVDPCIVGIIKKNHSMTAEFCFFECSPLPRSVLREKIFPIFSQLTSNKYSVTGGVPMGLPYLLILCDGMATHMIQSNTSAGAILIALPCNCHLSYGGKKFLAQEPCNEPINVEHVVEFSNHHHDTPTTTHEEEDFIDYLIETMDSNQYNVTFSESPEPKSPEKAASQGQTHVNEVTQVHCGHVLLWIFLITLLLLNLATLLILYKNGIINFGGFLFAGATSNISRLNEIPISNLNISSNN